MKTVILTDRYVHIHTHAHKLRITAEQADAQTAVDTKSVLRNLSLKPSQAWDSRLWSLKVNTMVIKNNIDIHRSWLQVSLTISVHRYGRNQNWCKNPNNSCQWTSATQTQTVFEMHIIPLGWKMGHFPNCWSLPLSEPICQFQLLKAAPVSFQISVAQFRVHEQGRGDKKKYSLSADFKATATETK